jgi:hypothetical protein
MFGTSLSTVTINIKGQNIISDDFQQFEALID